MLGSCISSYSVSLAALLKTHASLRKDEAGRKPKSAVLIGIGELANATWEAERVAQILRSLSMSVRMPRPYIDEALRVLRDCEIFHFAGHRSSNFLYPSRSGLVLNQPLDMRPIDPLVPPSQKHPRDQQQTDVPVETKPADYLTVSNLFEINLHRWRLFLAYLSACSTGQVKDDRGRGAASDRGVPDWHSVAGK